MTTWFNISTSTRKISADTAWLKFFYITDSSKKFIAMLEIFSETFKFHGYCVLYHVSANRTLNYTLKCFKHLKNE